jgi:hypothetical protein
MNGMRRVRMRRSSSSSSRGCRQSGEGGIYMRPVDLTIECRYSRAGSRLDSVTVASPVTHWTERTVLPVGEFSGNIPVCSLERALQMRRECGCLVWEDGQYIKKG